MVRPILLATVLSLVVACAGDGTGGTSSRTGAMCSEDIPFAPTYLPQGVDGDAKPGAGGGAAPPVDQVVVHFQGRQGVFIDLFRGGSRYPIATGRPITVLGQRAQIGAIQDGYGVDFAYGTAVLCNRYHLEAFGVGEDDVRRFAEGLEPR